MKDTIRGKFVAVSENKDLKVKNRVRDGYFHVTLRTLQGKDVKIYLSQRTLLEKVYIKNQNNGQWIKTGLIKPRLGLVVEVEGHLDTSQDYMNRVSKIKIIQEGDPSKQVRKLKNEVIRNRNVRKLPFNNFRRRR